MPALHDPAANLEHETRAAEQLISLLEQEQELLVKSQVEELASLTMEKAKAIAAMSELANQRYQALAQAGFESNESGMKAWVARPDAGDASRAWQALLDIAARAKELNRLNGKLINQQMARNQQALTALTASQAAGTMYGPKGQATTGPSSRHLGIG
ncbi:flagella synthesis protein FlgN [Noviherbaspirillum galbum]|uniref:Flagellar protein FlgN n=1 Tax=Noviherbaspirillum galbum TaxID=2709383 RepID=A0A6B3SWB7_9BURK|nr:flagellar protein FlgN [Noviherbaspirillum galbum]NEX62672.1 flagellar protein FlgN [Noviherbaspirillum galbum]